MATKYIDKFSFAKYLDLHYCDRCKAILFANNVDFHPRFCWSCRIKDVMNDLETFQTEDVKERKYGEWLYEGMIDKAWRVYTCSLCGGKCIDGGAHCPTCGAEMQYEDDV